MNTTRRYTDRVDAPFTRGDRLYNDAGLWYFRTREGAPMGPFRYRNEAESMLQRFISGLCQIEQARQASATRRKLRFRTSASIGIQKREDADGQPER